MTKHTVKQELQIILGFIAVLWAIYFVDILPVIELKAFGLVPRTLTGLVGIVTMPFLHLTFPHLLSNTVPLFVLLALLAGSRANSLAVIIAIVVLNGLLLWLFGRNAVHVGASGLIYGLITFLMFAGCFERRPVAIGVALIVFFLYGTTLIFGVLPTVGSSVSWDGHLTGAIAGAIIAFTQSSPLTASGTLQTNQE